MTSRLAQTLALCIALAALIGPTTAGARTSAAPTGLHPFLLRVDEPASRSFSRTPGFAWNPVKGAQRYEFQLSTSASFRESGVVYSDTSLTSPVASPALTLPWITGSPHALYARVRAVLADSTTAWSNAYGFDMEPAAVPSPLASYPGLLRWTPVDGAVAYQVWFVDVPKTVLTQTNVADQREFYSFHQAASWLGQVRWRIRALRDDFNTRANGLPAVAYGPWSPVYSSVNPPFAVGPLKPAATVSDVVTSGAASGAGAQADARPSSSAATSRCSAPPPSSTASRCSRTSAASTASTRAPSSAARPTRRASSGPLALPRTGAAITAARTSYLADGDEGPSFAFDMESRHGQRVDARSDAHRRPAGGRRRGCSAPAPAPAPARASGSTPAPAPAPAAARSAPSGFIELLKAPAKLGPPVGLWDTDWSHGGGYYWTVIPVEAKVPGASSTSLAGAGAAIGGSSLPVANSGGFAVGDSISVGNPGNPEAATITTVAAGTIGVAAPLKLAHGAGEPVVRTSGNIQYRDLELAQDACAAGRVMRFGKESEPTLTAGGEAFVSGLSPDGKLESADAQPAFYGSPLVAWTPALGAETYAVQWSKTREPFVAAADPASGALGMMTLNTSAVLPLEPGTWYYRVRGYDYSLPQGAQAMSWSNPQKVVATRPVFSVVGSSSSVRKTRTLSSASAGLRLEVPASFKVDSRSTARSASGPRPLGQPSARLRLTATDSATGATLFVQTSPDRVSSSHSAWVRKVVAGAKRAPGRVGAVSCGQVSLAAGAGVRCALTVQSAGTRRAAVLLLLQHRNVTYALTYVGSPAKRGTDSARFSAAARSLRFTAEGRLAGP